MNVPNETLGAPTPQFWAGRAGLPRLTHQWRISNEALARLLNRHRAVLGHAVVMARDIRRAIDGLAPAMASLCRRTCRFCPDPCCITNTVWFDFRDLLVLHLLGTAVPTGQAATDRGEPCPFLGRCGCKLPWSVRPWMCIKYVCPAQRARLDKREPTGTAAVTAVVNRIEKRRMRLEREVIRRIRRMRRTRPSSFSACSG